MFVKCLCNVVLFGRYLEKGIHVCVYVLVCVRVPGGGGSRQDHGCSLCRYCRLLLCIRYVEYSPGSCSSPCGWQCRCTSSACTHTCMLLLRTYMHTCTYYVHMCLITLTPLLPWAPLEALQVWFALPRLEALIAALLLERCLAEFLLPLLGIACKWIVIGKYRAGSYNLFSLYYLRWWFVDQVLQTLGRGAFRHTQEGLRIYYRLLGAEIGSGVVFDQGCRLAEHDLIRIGDRTSVDDVIIRQAHTHTHTSICLSTHLSIYLSTTRSHARPLFDHNDILKNAN